MKLLVVAPFFPYKNLMMYSGIFIADQVVWLKKLGVDVSVVTFVPMTPWPVKSLKFKWKVFSMIPPLFTYQDVYIRVFRYISLPRNLCHEISMLMMSMHLSRICNYLKPDIIHAHFAFPTGLAAVNVGIKYGIPVILTVHGSDVHTLPYRYNRYKDSIIKALGGAKQVLCVSQYIKEVTLKLNPNARARVHRIGIDLSIFKVINKMHIASNLAKEILNENVPIIIFIGNLLKEKGVMELLEAFNLMKDIKSKLVYIGDGPMSKEIIVRAKSFGLSDRVRLLGAQTHNSIPDYLNIADVLVLPSYRESLSMTCVEALACGVPIVATEVGGIPEVVKNFKTGLLVPPKNINALKDAIKWILLNKSQAKEIAKEGRKLVERIYNIESNTRNLISIYHEILQ